uniref:ATP synthase complex subunit 8 n=1 Tax=Petitella bleheri TaxID=3359282 RepID=A0A0K2SET4_9TELE|nr:ATP synthase F0 subunit 8 [Hemigrammus bleheri]QIA91278.1 ATP synthase F0 subunit 8 [Hemigrammus bleheri]BAS25616.1 ATPase subunit 8 [Hemigrammus bleheri]
MPQLIVDPWFNILISSWVIFLIIIPPKVMKHYFNNEPKMAKTHDSKTYPWDWLWY